MYMYDLAKEHGAMLVNVEHRFYGDSYPTLDMSTSNLQYLSSQQGLADLARIIPYIKNQYSTTSSTVITVGGSYPGNMAAWFKLKYPQVTRGSIASSAPLTAQANFKEYMEVVADAILYFSGQSCFDAFQSAAVDVASLAYSPEQSGYAKLEADFLTCSPMSSSKDVSILLSDLMGNIQGTVQYNNEKSGVMNVTDICSTMLTAGSTPYENFVTLSELYLQSAGMTCQDVAWKDTVDYLAAIQKDPSNNMRPWTYQTCNEFGYYQTADSPTQPFHPWASSLDMDFYRALCYEGFDGWTADPQTEWMNEVYGGIGIDGTDIIFPAGKKMHSLIHCRCEESCA